MVVERWRGGEVERWRGGEVERWGSATVLEASRSGVDREGGQGFVPRHSIVLAAAADPEDGTQPCFAGFELMIWGRLRNSGD